MSRLAYIMYAILNVYDDIVIYMQKKKKKEVINDIQSIEENNVVDSLNDHFNIVRDEKNRE
jgi:hypothetical protein